MATDRTIELAHPDRLYIGGEWVKPSTADCFEVLDCNTEQVAARVARAGSADAQRAGSRRRALGGCAAAR